jgi:hypothetical protein
VPSRNLTHGALCAGTDELTGQVCSTAANYRGRSYQRITEANGCLVGPECQARSEMHWCWRLSSARPAQH